MILHSVNNGYKIAILRKIENPATGAKGHELHGKGKWSRELHGQKVTCAPRERFPKIRPTSILPTVDFGCPFLHLLFVRRLFAEMVCVFIYLPSILLCVWKSTDVTILMAKVNKSLLSDQPRVGQICAFLSLCLHRPYSVMQHIWFQILTSSNGKFVRLGETPFVFITGEAKPQM